MTMLTRKGRTAAVTVLLLLVLFQTAQAKETWQTSFEQTCSKTSEGMTLSVAELTTLIDECTALQKIIEFQEESVRKVYLKRLLLCRNLYAYMLEYKKNPQPAK